MITFAFATLAIVVALACLRAPVFVWSAAVGVVGATWATVLGFGAATNSALAAAFAAGALALNVPSLRRRVLSDPVLAIYRRILPDMSQTEKEAIDAGTVWWDADLFSGRRPG
jgi:acyl-CoA dehydrogenase